MLTCISLKGITSYVDTAADVNLISLDVYKKRTPEPMNSALSVYNANNIQALGTFTIPLVLSIDNTIHNANIYIPNHNGSELLSYQDSLHMQLVHPYPALTKHPLEGAFPIGSEHSSVYINFIKCKNKQLTIKSSKCSCT